MMPMTAATLTMMASTKALNIYVEIISFHYFSIYSESLTTDGFFLFYPFLFFVVLKEKHLIAEEP